MRVEKNPLSRIPITLSEAAQARCPETARALFVGKLVEHEHAKTEDEAGQILTEHRYPLSAANVTSPPLNLTLTEAGLLANGDIPTLVGDLHTRLEEAFSRGDEGAVRRFAGNIQAVEQLL